jgi:phosphinothricin acetyltransferase
MNDAKIICDIYNYYVKDTIITFEESPIGVEEMKSRIVEVTKELPWIVFEENKCVVGYAYASRWKSRCAYRYSVESTVYVDPYFKNRKIGSLLYSELINILGKKKMHSILAGIALPNEHSVKFHEKFDFVNVAHLKEVGWKFEKWIDVGYWQLNLGSAQNE